jgi:hypothetical protein
MNATECHYHVVRGVCIQSPSHEQTQKSINALESRLTALRLIELTRLKTSPSGEVRVALCSRVADDLVPTGDTLQLAASMHLDSRNSTVDLEREILVAMLASPVPFRFPDYAEFRSAIQMRMSIVQVARNTRLQFETQTAERPADYWRYDDERGFVLLPGRSLIAGLREATQPSDPAIRYSFSCWRATEHIALLAIAQETAAQHPELYRQITRQSQLRALKASNFERVYLCDHGSAKEPLPVRYFVPGDRTWFRNPDPRSADVAGFEGSFTFYLGAGEFANFWRDCIPFTLTTKCLTIYHWRNALVTNSNGETQVDEAKVDTLVHQSLLERHETDRILHEMVRWQAHPESFDGGAIELTRKVPRHICPGTANIVLPDVTPTVRSAIRQESAPAEQ